jgi:hypothetical protein
MVWRPDRNAPLGIANGNPTVPDAAAVCPVGTLCQFFDDVLGSSEFVYMPGVNGLTAGDAVVLDLTPGAQAVIRHVSVTYKNSGRPVGVAVGAPQAGQYGWMQIAGVAIVNVVAGSAVGAAFGSATTGALSSTSAAGDQILNSRLVTAIGTPAAGKAYLQLSEPCVQSQIT